MNLKYRGIAYEVSPVVINTPKTYETATYRGQSYQVSSCVEVKNRSSESLAYRGNNYYPRVIDQLDYCCTDLALVD